ncbi:MAG: ERF family protein [Phycisphaerae bacterium]|nr:ERF family protein [Phycisphaerae bacterium]
MTKSESINELATALVKAQEEIKHAPMLNENPYFKSKYANLPTVIDTAKPILCKYGLAVVQTVGGMDGEIDVATILMHTSGQWISNTISFKPQKPGIQDAGAVITYLRRYSYAAIVGTASEEDDDGNSDAEPPKQPQGKLETPPAKSEMKIDDEVKGVYMQVFEYMKSLKDKKVTELSTPELFNAFKHRLNEASGDIAAKDRIEAIRKELLALEEKHLSEGKHEL